MTITIDDIITRIKADKQKLGITLYDKATDLDISKFEISLNIKLPEDIKTFYKFCNGFESEEDMFRVIPLKEISDSKDDYKPNQFYVAEYLLYCDMWTIDINPTDTKQYSIYNCDKDMEWLFLTNSFTDFLNNFLDNGVFGNNGLYDWHNKVKMRTRT